MSGPNNREQWDADNKELIGRWSLVTVVGIIEWIKSRLQLIDKISQEDTTRNNADRVIDIEHLLDLARKQLAHDFELAAKSANKMYERELDALAAQQVSGNTKKDK